MKTSHLKCLMSALLLLIGISASADTTGDTGETAGSTVNCTSIKELQEQIDANPDENITANITFADEVRVTAYNDKYAYISDGKYGVMVKDDNGLLKQGDAFRGTISNVWLGKDSDYGAYMVKDFLSSDALTITSGNVFTPSLLTLHTISQANIGRYITLRSVTYTYGYDSKQGGNIGKLTDADGNSIYCIDLLGANVTLTDGNKYDITGVIGYSHALVFMPTAVSAAAVDGQITTATTFSNVTNSKLDFTMGKVLKNPVATVKAGDTVIDDAELTYSSSNENAATVASDGTLTVKGGGITWITATYDGNGTFKGSTAKYCLTVTAVCKKIEEMQAQIDQNPTENITANLTFQETTYVTAVHDGRAYVSNGDYGLVIMDDDNTLKAGDSFLGEVQGALLCAVDGAYTIKDFTAGNLTITHNNTLKAAETSVNGIAKANLGKYVTIKDVTYNSNGSVATFTDKDGNSIYCYDGLETSLALTDGYKYDVTGVVGYYNAVQMMPTEVTQLTGEASLSTATAPATKINTAATDTYTLNYVGDGTVSVTSSNPDVATAAYDAESKTVTVTAVEGGKTTVKISASKGEYYGAPAPIEYTLKVVADDTEDIDIVTSSELGIVTGHESGTWSADRTNLTLEFTDANSRKSDIAVYSNSTVTVKAKEGYLVSKVELTLTNASSNTGAWADADETALSPSHGVISWTGIASSVTLANNRLMASLADISVSYIKLTDTGKTVSIGKTGRGTYCATEKCVIGDGSVTKYVTGVDETSNILVETTADILAVGEGVLLNGAEGTYTVYTHERLNPTAETANKLVGCTEATTVSTGCYVLQNLNNKVAFYCVSADDPITCPAGKAYLQLDASEAKALFFNDGTATAIGSIEADGDATRHDIYTLSGVKVNGDSLTKGIYVVNGKKYIVK